MRKFLILVFSAALLFCLWWFLQDDKPDSLTGVDVIQQKVKEGEEDAVPSITSFPSGGRYTHVSPTFSFLVPKAFTVRVLAAEGGMIMVIEGPSSRENMQVFYNFIDDKNPVTKERIVNEVPDIKISMGQDIKIDGARGYFFNSDNPAYEGVSREAWFSHDGYLYQVTTHQDNDRLIEQLISSWQWKI